MKKLLFLFAILLVPVFASAQKVELSYTFAASGSKSTESPFIMQPGNTFELAINQTSRYTDSKGNSTSYDIQALIHLKAKEDTVRVQDLADLQSPFGMKNFSFKPSDNEETLVAKPVIYQKNDRQAIDATFSYQTLKKRVVNGDEVNLPYLKISAYGVGNFTYKELETKVIDGVKNICYEISQSVDFIFESDNLPEKETFAVECVVTYIGVVMVPDAPTLVKVEYTPGWKWLGWTDDPYTGFETNDAYYIYAVRERLFSDGSVIKDTIYNHTNFMNSLLNHKIQYNTTQYANYKILTDEEQFDLTHAIRKVSVSVRDLSNISFRETSRTIENSSKIYCDEKYSDDDGWYHNNVWFDCILTVKNREEDRVYDVLLILRPNVARLHYLTLDGQTVYFPETTYDVKITEENIPETDEFGPGKRISYIVEYVLLGKTFYAGCELTVYQEKEEFSIPEQLTYSFFNNTITGKLEAIVTGSNEAVSGHVEIPDYMTLTRAGGREVPVTAIGDRAFESQGISVVRMGGNMRTIGSCAFSECKEMYRVELPGSLTEIGDWAFRGCNSLGTILSHSTTPPSVGDYGLAGIDKSTCTLRVPEEAVEAYKAADGWKDFARIQPLNGSAQLPVVSPSVSSTHAPAYNLMGMPVGKDYKGIVIQGGKKMVQK